MPEPKKIKARLIDAAYIKDAKSVLLMLECDQGKFRSQIPRDSIASYGNRTEEEIEIELNKYVDILKYTYVGKDKYINAVFDTELNGKIKDHYKLKY